ncbi:MAG: nucleotidyltransferase family protein [Clostridia bacterium]|nr:nucleotidyltransferase family protein [Clostridia bacterium]
MTEVQSLLIRLLGDHLDGRPTDAGGALPPGLTVLSAIHGLSGFLTAQLGDRFSGDEEQTLLSALGACAAEYVRRRENYDELKKAFSEAGLWFIPVKGILVAEEYPVPELRVMGDIDIIVSKRERKAVENLLKTLGWREVSRSGDTVTYDCGTGSMDVRASLPSETGISEPSEGSAGEIIPDRAEHLTYLVAHLANHVKETGCGIRQFLDIAVFLKKGGADGERVKELIAAKGLSDFAPYAFGLTEKWFGAPPPYDTGEPDEELLSRLSDEIFTGGVFGRQNGDNALLFSARSAAGGAGPVRIFFRRLFPPYRQMRQFGYCGWLNGRPYLLPVAWIVRIFRCVFTRSPAESLKTASEPFRYKNEIGDRADFLARLGIPLDREFF